MTHLLAALTLLAASPSLATPPAEPIQLRLIAINDFHGNLEEGVGGWEVFPAAYEL
ncbi:MAG: hypothetical protein ACK41W_00745 [Cyanobacteriota bacterium]